jgi:hypothetical protein
VLTTFTATLLVVSSALVVWPFGCLEDVVVVVDVVAPVVDSFSSLSTDTELACHSIIIPFTTCTLATTIDAILNEFLGTYRSELRWIVVKARCRGLT